MRALSVAVLGAKGNVGWHTILALLSAPYAPSFKRIVAVSRTPFDDFSGFVSLQSRCASDLPGLPRFTTRPVEYASADSVARALEGIDIVVDATNFKGPDAAASKAGIEAAVNVSRTVQLFLPSEFGVDWREHDFAEATWDGKKAHQATLRRKRGLKVVAVYCGLVMERAFGAWFSYDFGSFAFRPAGSPSSRVSFTSLADVGRVVATLATLAVRNGPTSLPDHLRVAGETLDYHEVAAIMAAADPLRRQIAMDPVDADAVEQSLRAGRPLDKSWGGPADWIRLLAGTGRLDYEGKDEYTLPGTVMTGRQYVEQAGVEWEWETVRNYAESVQGRPWL